MQNQINHSQFHKEQPNHQFYKQELLQMKLVGDLATIANLLMYISYIGDVIANLNGNPISPVQPMFAAINAALWTGYGWLEPHKDWRLIIADFPGIIFGLLVVVTAIW